MKKRCSKSPQNSTCDRVSFLIKFQALGLLLKKRLWHRYSPVNFAKLLRTSTGGYFCQINECFHQLLRLISSV